MASGNRPTYGGQAVIEGVMIRGQSHASIAVRRPDGTVALRCDPLNSLYTGRLRRLPLVRGVLVLIETLTLGMRALTYSANVGMEAEDKEIGRGAVALMLSLSMLFAVTIFFLLPVLASKAIESPLGSDLLSNLAEGLIRLALFLGYIYLIGRMDQIKRVFMYHGAEHMTVHAQEASDPLEIEAVRRYPKAHPRCGTAFLLTVMVVAIAVFTFVGRDPFWWLIASRVVLVPFVAAISYEAIRFSGSHARNPLVRLLAAPSLALQSLTTRRPDDDQIEIAIAAMEQALAADGVQAAPREGVA
jgi:uncharacterized protein YqhQ